MTGELGLEVRGRRFDTGAYAAFLDERRRHFAGRRRPPPPPEWSDVLGALFREGVAVVPGFLPTVTSEGMLATVPGPEAFSLSSEADGSESVSDAHLIPGFAPFFHHPGLAQMARWYIGPDAVPLRQKLEVRRVQGPILAFDRLFHMDTWKDRLKAFLYLHDVGPAEAPLAYLRGSHRGAWRWPEEYRIRRSYRVDAYGYAAHEDLAYLGCFLPHEVAHLKRRFGFQEKLCTGQAGTLVLFDARGVHRATALSAPSRSILISYWVREGHHV